MAGCRDEKKNNSAGIMNASLKKGILIVAGLLLICTVLVCVIWREGKEQGIVSVTFLDVGQGDSIVIQTPDDATILIDGGPDSGVLSELGSVMPFYDHTIELVLLTHAHADHVAGLVEVLSRYEVTAVVYSDVRDGSSEFLAFQEAIATSGVQTLAPVAGKVFQFGDVSLEVLYPFTDISGQSFDDLNEASVVTKLQYRDISFLLTGDAPVSVEESLLGTYEPDQLQSDVLKVGHHGSKYSSSIEFLNAVDPDLAVMQVGEGNTFGHPHRLILRRFEGLGIPFLRNDLNGTIGLQTDGSRVWVSDLDK